MFRYKKHYTLGVVPHIVCQHLCGGGSREDQEVKAILSHIAGLKAPRATRDYLKEAKPNNKQKTLQNHPCRQGRALRVSLGSDGQMGQGAGVVLKI